MFAPASSFRWCASDGAGIIVVVNLTPPNVQPKICWDKNSPHSGVILTVCTVVADCRSLPHELIAV